MTSSAGPLVSVIVPCYNLGAYLDEAIQSVLAQTVQDFEILVVDDGSTDEATRALCASGEWPQTTLYRIDNRGLAGARNFLIERARGHYLCALDADDKLHPRYFEHTLAAFERDPSLTFVSTRMQMFGEADQVWPLDLRCDLPMLLCHDPVFSAALVRRQAVCDVGGYDEHLIQGDEDWDLWISILEHRGKGVILPEILFYYRRRSGSLCDICTRGETHLGLLRYLMQKHRDSYRAHIVEVLRWKEEQLGELNDKNARLALELDTNLEPTLTRRRAELERLRGGLDRLRHPSPERDRTADDVAVLREELEKQRREIDAMRLEYERCLSEVGELRASASWKITAPLRASYELLHGPRRRKAE
jgi:glycosyltransferase involved in cell wall biosynthesis